MLTQVASQWASWRVMHVAPTTARLERWIIEHTLGQLEGLDRSAQARWLDQIRSRHGEATARRAMVVLRAIVNWGVERGYLGEEVELWTRLVRIPRPRKNQAPERVPDPLEVARAAGAAPPRKGLAIVVAALTGLRWGEQFSLRGEDVLCTDSGILIHVHRNRPAGTRWEYAPKTPAATRYVPVYRFLGPYLLEAARMVGPSSLLFGGRGGAPVSYQSWLRCTWKPALQAAGVGPYRWHQLRHLAASLWIAQGWSPADVAEVMGHSRPEVTMRIYVHSFRARRHGVRITEEEIERMFRNALIRPNMRHKIRAGEEVAECTVRSALPSFVRPDGAASGLV